MDNTRNTIMYSIKQPLMSYTNNNDYIITMFYNIFYE